MLARLALTVGHAIPAALLTERFVDAYPIAIR
jgi:hypothetical protein